MEVTSSHKCIKNTFTCGIILTEYLRNTGRWYHTTRAARSPRNWIGWKGKKKKKKESGQNLCPREGILKGERCPHPGNPLHWLGDQLGQIESFRGSEESAAACLQQAGQRETCTEGHLATSLHTPAWDMYLPVYASAGCWNPGFSGQTQGQDSVWLCRDSPKDLECGLSHNWWCEQDGVQVHNKSPIINARLKGGVWPRHSSLILSLLTMA